MGVTVAAQAGAEPRPDWGSVANCAPCGTEAFRRLRVYLAGQHRGAVDPAGSAGNVVAIRDGRLDRIGRMSLFGFGNLATTDYHVLFREDDEPFWGRETTMVWDPLRDKAVEAKASDDGKLYFESHRHRGLQKLIEIELESFRSDCAFRDAARSLQCDGVQVRLKQDATSRFARDANVYAALWDYQVDHDVLHAASSRLTFVRKSRKTYPFGECRSVAPHHPGQVRSRISLEHVFFHGCPTRNTDSGAQLIYTDAHDVRHLWGFHLGKVMRVKLGKKRETKFLKLGIALTPGRVEVMNEMYFAEMRRRHVDPADPATWPPF